jgi:hypothetical protein
MLSSTVDQMSANTQYLLGQGHRLLQIGVVLLLLASFEGFGIPYFAAPAIGLAAHRLSALQSVLLLALGLVWPKLKLGAAVSRTAFWLLLYSTIAIWLRISWQLSGEPEALHFLSRPELLGASHFRNL